MTSSSILPPGFRFRPTDEELVGYYLKRKVNGQRIELEVIPVIDLYKFDPWELPEKSFLPKRDMEWFFFCPRDRKYPNGTRTNRATISGYWKATGKDRKVNCELALTALRKTLVFYRGRAPGGQRTDWVMHEYRLCDDNSPGPCNFVGAFALCRVVKRNEHGLKTGESQEEARAPRVVSPRLDELNRRKEVKNVASKKASLSARSIASPTITFSSHNAIALPSIGLDNDQASVCGSNDLSSIQEPISLEKNIFSDLSVHKEFAIPFETCAPSNIYPAAHHTSQKIPSWPTTDASNPEHFMGVYSNQDQITTQSNIWDIATYMNQTFYGHEAWTPALPPVICRQASEEEFNLWLQDDSFVSVK